MATATTPAKPRKQLADQLDRLDGIIDLLAEGLPQAVADATRAGTCETLVELLADPEVIARLRAALTPGVQEAPAVPTSAATRPGSFARLKSAVVNAVARAVRLAKAGFATAARRVKAVAVAASFRIRAAVLRNFRVEVPVVRTAAAALAAGVLAATVGYAAPPEVAAALCGFGAAAVTAVVLLGVRVRRSFRTRTFAPTR